MKFLYSILTPPSECPAGQSVLYSRIPGKFYNLFDYLYARIRSGVELRLATTYDYASPYQNTEAQFTDVVPAGFEIETVIYHHRGTTPAGLISLGTQPGLRDVVGETAVITNGSESLPVGNSYFGNQTQTLYLTESPSWTPGSELAILIIMRDKLARIPSK